MPRQGCGVGAKLELRALSEPEVVDKYTVSMAWGVHLGQRGARTQALPRRDAAQPAAQVLQAQVPVTSPRTPTPRVEAGVSDTAYMTPEAPKWDQVPILHRIIHK